MSQLQIFSGEDALECGAVVAAVELSMEEKVERAIGVIKGYLRRGYNMVSAFSAGKDSSCATDIFLKAVQQVVAEDGVCPACAVLNSNTLLENPEMDRYSRNEIKKIEAFVAKHNLPVTVQIATPSRSNNYLVNIIGGRTVASVAEMGDSKCSDMLKVSTINKAKAKLFKQFGMDNVITIIGKRFDESAVRGANMRARGESQYEAVKNENGEWILSAIADFTLDDVFEYIAYARNSMIDSYSDFEDMLQIYRDSNDGGACELVIASTGKSSKSGCGARHGCYLCLRTKDDKSMENMLKQDQYAYMRPLNDFRNYIRAHHFNPAKRNWLSRTVDEGGQVVIAPNAYSPDFCEDLLRMAVSIDANERDEASRLGIEPRFQMLSQADIIHIELLWSRYGYQKQFKACEIYREVELRGARYAVPVNEPIYPLGMLPRVSKKAPFADGEYFALLNGFRDPNLAVIDQESLVAKGGELYTDCQVDDEMLVDDEGAEMFFAFEVDYAIERYSNNAISPTACFHYFVGLGTVSLFKGGHSGVGRMLRMANQIHRHGIRDVLNDPDALLRALGDGGEAAGADQPDMFLAVA